MVFQQGVDNVALEFGSIAFIENNESGAVETNQTKLSANPEEARARLNNGGNRILREALFGAPHILVKFEMRICRTRASVGASCHDGDSRPTQPKDGRAFAKARHKKNLANLLDCYAKACIFYMLPLII
jgi:hypothetical protein